MEYHSTHIYELYLEPKLVPQLLGGQIRWYILDHMNPLRPNSMSGAEHRMLQQRSHPSNIH